MSSPNLSLEIQQQALANWDLVNKLANRRFHKETTAEEAALYAMETLAKDDWKRLKKFNGQSSFGTFLSSVVYRLLEDFSRSRFGRVLPPKWVQELGGIWLILFRLLCLERFPFNDALHIAQDKTSGVPSAHIEQAAEKIIGQIPNCGKSQQEQEFDEAQSVDESQKELLEEKQKRQVFNALCLDMFGTHPSENQQGVLSTLLKHKISLKSEERLLLKLCYRDGLSVTDAGRILGLTRFQVHGKHRRLLLKIKKHFIDAGYEKEILLLLQ